MFKWHISFLYVGCRKFLSYFFLSFFFLFFVSSSRLSNQEREWDWGRDRDTQLRDRRESLRERSRDETERRSRETERLREVGRWEIWLFRRDDRRWVSAGEALKPCPPWSAAGTEIQWWMSNFRWALQPVNRRNPMQPLTRWLKRENPGGSWTLRPDSSEGWYFGNFQNRFPTIPWWFSGNP
jgi:hypothetical protein